jgi:hypothetical protein
VPVQIKEDGSFEVLYTGPFRGINTQSPPNLIDDHETPAVSNVALRNSTLSSAPKLTITGTTLAAEQFAGLGSFQDAAFNWHTFGITYTAKLYELITPGPTWTLRHDYTEAATALVSWRVFNGVLYWVDGTVNAKSWDGAAAFVKGAFQVAGNSVGGFYLDELDQHVILASTHENDGFHTKRVRWSAIGLPTQFDPAVNLNAGFNDFIDVADDITGLMMLGRVGYVYHRTGIIEMAPTGVGVAPFDFNHVWNAQDGMGGVYNYCTGQFGSTGAFVSSDNIYLVQNYQFSPIGGKARDAIISYLAGTYFPIISVTSLINAGPAFQPYLVVIPSYSSTFPYPVVQIIAPSLSIHAGTPSLTRIFEYSIEEQFWTQYDLTVGMTCKPASAFGATAIF